MRNTRRIAIPVALLALLPVVGVADPSAAGPELVFCFGLPANVLGTGGPDMIDLNDGAHGPGPFVVATFGGDDVVFGTDLDDTACLGGGADRFEGDGGSDLASGGSGADVLIGGDGPDELRGGKGNDRIIGGPGDDDLRGGRENDHIDGGTGDDLIKGGRGDDRLNGGDSSTADSGADDIRGGRGFDRLWSDWSHFDGDDDSILRGGQDYDYCANGAEQHGCERLHYQASSFSAAREEWREMITDTFGRWGLDEEDCAVVNGEERCVGPQIEQALDVLVCESWGFPFAYAGSTGVSGLFQHRPEYFSGRLANAMAEGWVVYDWPDHPSIFDPELNAMVSAYLVWRSREVQLGRFAYSGYESGPPYLSNWAKGPEPWGHWSCGLHHDLWYPSWVHPSFDGV
ncbi:MAG: calcium-binding protein [Acidimicrobiia bacterium]